MARPDSDLEEASHLRLRRQRLLLLLAALLGLLAFGGLGLALEGGSGGGTPKGEDTPAGPFSRSWSFTNGLPPGWVSLARASHSGNEEFVRTRPTSTFQLYSSPIKLPAGTYRYSVTTRTVFGSLAVGVVDRSTQHFIDEQTRTTGRNPGALETFGGEFALPKAAPVALVLSNGTPPTQSLWALHAATILPLQGSISGIRSNGPVIRDWSFTDGLPSGWVALARTSRGNGGLDVSSRPSSRYRLYSSSLTLPPGKYRYVLTARALKGALALGALDWSRQRFLVQKTYSSQGSQLILALLKFRLTRPTAVALVLSNGTPGSPTHWSLVSAALRTTLAHPVP